MKIFSFIFARGGSKGVPGKNIRVIAGKPLIAYSIEVARIIPKIQEVFVSTDDESIAAVARKHGAEVIPRPTELAQDNSPEWLAWQHAVEWVENKKGQFEVFVSLPATSPLRNKGDVNACIKKLDTETDIVVTITKTNRSPWFNMVRLTREGYAKVLCKGKKTYSRRQDVPEAFDMTTVAYVARPQFIHAANNIFDGRVKSVLIPEERSLDIDTEHDIEFAEFMMTKRKSISIKQR